jgi:chemotaxis protein MotD
MTQIDAAPLAQGKPATVSLRDRGQRGPSEGDAETSGDKPRFGDHWRSMLSGGEAKGDAKGDPAAAPNDTESAEGKGRPPRFEALLRLPTDAFARLPDGAGDVSALSIDAAQPGEKIDITDVLDALKNAGRAAMGDVAGIPAKAGNAPPEAGTDGNGLARAAELLAAGNGHASGNAGEVTANAASAAHAVPARDAANAATLPATPPTTQPGRAPAQTPANRDLHLATRADAAQPALKATVMHQATHFAPALGATNIQAISSAITEAAGDLREGMTRSASDPAAQQSTFRPGGPVKTLTIQLTPISLGKVTVEMRIGGGAMKVDIQVADPKALELVRADKDLIMNLVRKTGVVPDNITIQSADNASSTKPNQNGQGGANGSGFDREASRDGAGRSGRDGQNDTDNGGLTHDERKTGDAHLRGDIYL